jgi:ABC-type multidrug transport system ATPase subunit
MYHALFRSLTCTFDSAKNYVSVGGNGSGKSTLLKIIAGGTDSTEGKIEYSSKGKNIDRATLPEYISFCSPYMDLIEEFTFLEIIKYQKKFKAFKSGLSVSDIIDISTLKGIDNKPIRNYSSGMKQRIKLTLAATADVEMILLDEPTSNLDPAGKKWYSSLLDTFGKDKTIIVASNHQEEEYPENPMFIHIADYKR